MGFYAGMGHLETSSFYPTALQCSAFYLARGDKVIPDAIPSKKRPFPFFSTTEWFLLCGDSITIEFGLGVASGT